MKNVIIKKHLKKRANSSHFSDMDTSIEILNGSFSECLPINAPRNSTVPRGVAAVVGSSRTVSVSCGAGSSGMAEVTAEAKPSQTVPALAGSSGLSGGSFTRHIGPGGKHIDMHRPPDNFNPNLTSTPHAAADYEDISEPETSVRADLQTTVEWDSDSDSGDINLLDGDRPETIAFNELINNARQMSQELIPILSQDKDNLNRLLRKVKRDYRRKVTAIKRQISALDKTLAISNKFLE